MSSKPQTIHLGEYEVDPTKKNRIGKGSFGYVYIGHNKRNNEKVAVKKIELDNEEDDTSIYGELTSMDVLRGHPNVVQLFDAKFGDLECWIVMELCEGDLQNYLKVNKDRLTLEDKVHLMYQAVSPIAFMHSQKPPIIHRDIKPGNFLYQVSADGKVILKVTDFGLAKLYDRENASDTMRLHSDTMCGTVHYMAPEFWVHDTLKYGNTVDNFALGLMFHVILLADATSKDYPFSGWYIVIVFEPKTTRLIRHAVI